MNSDKSNTAKIQPRKKRSNVMISHYFSLAWRGAICITLLILWIGNIIHGGETIMYRFESHPWIMRIIWLLFVIDMVARFFPSSIRSPGSQKQFAKNFQKTGKTEIIIPDNHATALVMLAWILFNGIFGALYIVGIPVLLPLPGVLLQMPVLRILPDLQLGFRDDVHASVLRAGALYMESAGNRCRPACDLGDHLLPAPGTFL